MNAKAKNAWKRVISRSSKDRLIFFTEFDDLRLTQGGLLARIPAHVEGSNAVCDPRREPIIDNLVVKLLLSSAMERDRLVAKARVFAARNGETCGPG